MSADSKKREELLRQIANRGKQTPTSLIEKAWHAMFEPKKYELVEKTTTIPGTIDIEVERFVICFDYLKFEICKLDFDGTKTRSLVRLLHSIATCKVNGLISSGLVRDKVTNAPPYSNLFSDLSPEVEMLEAEISGGGRVFFFVTGKKFNIVSIEAEHRDAHHNVGYST